MITDKKRTSTKKDEKMKIIKTDTENLFKIKSDKRRVNITINPYIWEEMARITTNKSLYIENLLKDLIEKETNQKIIRSMW